jgi:hypothetical protein
MSIPFRPLLPIAVALLTLPASAQLNDCPDCTCTLPQWPGTTLTTQATHGPCGEEQSLSLPANNHGRFHAEQGNTYTISFCGLAANTFAFVTTDDAQQTVLTCDLDGCGTFHGPSRLRFTPTSTGTYRLHVFAGLCGILLTAGEVPLLLQCTTSEPPLNDTCEAATALTPQAWCEEYLSSLAGAAPGGAADCLGPGSRPDVWFSFVAQEESVTVRVQGLVDLDALLSIHAGDCGDPVELGCVNDSLAGQLEQLAISGLQVGSTYLVRVQHAQPMQACETLFSICVVEGLPTAIPPVAGGALELVQDGTGRPVVINRGAACTVDLRVLDSAGRRVHQARMSLMAGEERAPALPAMAPGAYLLHLSTDGNTTMTRFFATGQ